MNIKKYIDTFILVKKINQNKKQEMAKIEKENEICENYYSIDDKLNDGRGNF